MLRWNRFAGLATALVATGCFNGGGSDGCVPANANGLVGNGAFSYVCRSEADQGCTGGSGLTPLGSIPSSIARGASFGLQFDGKGRSFTVEPVSTRTVLRESTWFRSTRAGTVGFLVQDGGEVVDAVRLAFVEPTRVLVPSPSEDLFSKPSAQVGQEVRLHAVPYGSVSGTEMPLAGALPVTWTTDAADVTLDTTVPGVAAFVPRRPGRVVIRADFEGRLSGEVALEVEGNALPSSDAGSVDASAADASDGGAP